MILKIDEGNTGKCNIDQFVFFSLPFRSEYDVDGNERDVLNNERMN